MTPLRRLKAFFHFCVAKECTIHLARRTAKARILSCVLQLVEMVFADAMDGLALNMVDSN